jgi:DNA-binding beta-propeller fold protein YncE
VADGKGMIYDNLEDKNEVVAIDTRALRITARWPVAPAGQPVSMAMDRERRRLFIGARNPSVFVVMDADSGKIIGSPFPIGARVDTTVFDPETKLAACSTGDGGSVLFHERDSESRRRTSHEYWTDAAHKFPVGRGGALPLWRREQSL